MRAGIADEAERSRQVEPVEEQGRKELREQNAENHKKKNSDQAQP